MFLKNLEVIAKELCPSHYLRAPALSWDAMLNSTKIRLKLVSDLWKSMKGGVSYISNRYSKAKNKCLKSNDPKQESKLITYLDTNNLCGYAMSKFLPTSGFKWIDPKEFDLNKYFSNSSKGYILKTDLEYPKELRELHNDYSLTLDKIEIKGQMLCSYHLNVADHYNIAIGSAKKIMPNFFDK